MNILKMAKVSWSSCYTKTFLFVIFFENFRKRLIFPAMTLVYFFPFSKYSHGANGGWIKTL
jgi:hypothetical protein